MKTQHKFKNWANLTILGNISVPKIKGMLGCKIRLDFWDDLKTYFEATGFRFYFDGRSRNHEFVLY